MDNADEQQIMFVLYVAFAITGVHHGTGQHIGDIQPATEVPIGLKVSCSFTFTCNDSSSFLICHPADMR